MSVPRQEHDDVVASGYPPKMKHRPDAAFAAGTPSSIRPTPSVSANADAVISVNSDTSPNVDGKRMEQILVNAQDCATGTRINAP